MLILPWLSNQKCYKRVALRSQDRGFWSYNRP